MWDDPATSKEPALLIERVDVPVRLEKRLAALLTPTSRRARA
ncbi:MAG: hypothetical protein ABI601_12415 [bacterium]